MARTRVIASLSDEVLKLELLSSINNDYHRAEIIATLGEYKEKENEKKKEVIEQIDAKKDRLEELLEEEKKLDNEQKRNALIEKKVM